MARQLYLDMDGTLADFDKKAREVLGTSMADFERQWGAKEAWTRLLDLDDFYNTFDPMPDAHYLWAKTQHLAPIILTGIPSSRSEEVAAQKRKWVARMFGGYVPVITCRSKDKALYCKPGDILIDDRTDYKHLWEAAGGHYIVHESARRSMSIFERKTQSLEWR
jgi:hypothetical protein